jgi:nitronate monooxygenase
MLRTRFTDLVGCSVPVQQAGMGWIAGPDLAAAVADAGGLGMIAMPLVPTAVLADMLTSLERRTTGAFGVNFLMPFLDRDGVEVAAGSARVVEFFYGDPDPALVATVHAGGALACWQIGSVAEARAAAEVGCDLIVAQGIEAGGHVRGKLALLPLLAQVLDAVDVPVVAAGGIASPRAMAAALAAGAAAVRVGTLLVATEEADAHPDYVQALIRARSEDTVLTEAFSVMWPDAPHRVLSSAVASAEALASETAGQAIMAGATVPIPRLAPMAPTRSVTGAIDAMALYAGQSVGAVQRVQPAAEVVGQLTQGAERLLRQVATDLAADPDPGRPAGGTAQAPELQPPSP